MYRILQYSTCTVLPLVLSQISPGFYRFCVRKNAGTKATMRLKREELQKLPRTENVKYGIITVDSPKILMQHFSRIEYKPMFSLYLACLNDQKLFHMSQLERSKICLQFHTFFLYINRRFC